MHWQTSRLLFLQSIIKKQQLLKCESIGRALHLPVMCRSCQLMLCHCIKQSENLSVQVFVCLPTCKKWIWEIQDVRMYLLEAANKGLNMIGLHLRCEKKTDFFIHRAWLLTALAFIHLLDTQSETRTRAALENLANKLSKRRKRNSIYFNLDCASRTQRSLPWQS